jgi:hypothetical protein
MEERNTGLRTASHLARLLRGRHARYVEKRATLGYLTTVIRNAVAVFSTVRVRLARICA